MGACPGADNPQNPEFHGTNILENHSGILIKVFRRSVPTGALLYCQPYSGTGLRPETKPAMKDPQTPSDDDKQLFRQSIGRVRRLRSNTVEPVAARPPPVPRQRQLDDRLVLDEMLSDDVDTTDLETGDELWFSRSGLQKRVLQKLRRGQYALQGELDLHGMTVAVARSALVQFLAECRAHRHRCVRIVHGKGLGSARQLPVLKGKVAGWLRQRDDVLAFCSARRTEGGSGAVYVLLKTR